MSMLVAQSIILDLGGEKSAGINNIAMKEVFVNFIGILTLKSF